MGTGPPCHTSALLAGPSCTSARRSPTAAGRVLLEQGGAARLPRVGARRGAEGGHRGRDLARPSGCDQHAAVRPGPPEDRVPARAGAADLPARAVRGVHAPLRRASAPRAARLVGRPEAPLGSEALAAGGRLDPPTDGLEEPTHGPA